jgi:hypothetical protein
MFQEIVKTTSTLSGTTIKEGIEYNTYPPPSSVLKAMERKWAVELVDNGVIRLNSLEFYQTLENDQLGDTKEGLGEFFSSGHPYNVSSGNKVFVWCSAFPQTPKPTLLELYPKYDSIISVKNPIEFTKRIMAALSTKGYSFSLPHLGAVNYSRSTEVGIESVKSQLWHWNVFQKRESYVHQNEFRFAFTDTSFNLEQSGPIDIKIGPCSDIVACIKT